MPGGSDIRAGRAYVELGIRNQMDAALRRAERQLKTFGATLSHIGSGMMIGGAAILTPLLAAVKSYSAMGDELMKMSQRTGFSVEALSELKFAADQSGISLTDLDTAIRKMNSTVDDAGRGLKTAQDALSALGLSLDTVMALSPEQRFLTIADAISRIEDPGTRAAVAVDMFGRSGTAMLPMLADGAAGVQQLREQAQRLGLTMSTEAAAAAVEFQDTLSALQASAMMVFVEIGAALAGPLQNFALWVQDFVPRVRDWIKEHRDLVVGLLKFGAVLGGVGLAVFALGKVFAAFGAIVTGFRMAMTVASAVMAAFKAFAEGNVVPIVGVAIGLAAAAAAAIAVAKGYKKIFAEMDDGSEKSRAALAELQDATVTPEVDTRFLDEASDKAAELKSRLLDVDGTKARPEPAVTRRRSIEQLVEVLGTVMTGGPGRTLVAGGTAGTFGGDFTQLIGGVTQQGMAESMRQTAENTGKLVRQFERVDALRFE